MIAIRLRSAVWFATGAVLALVVSLLVLNTWRADAAPGDTDTTFVPMTGCRLIDTRPPPDRIGSFSTWGIKETKALQATGTNGNCTIPATAVSLSLNVTALNATQNGFLTFWATGPLPLAASLNPSPGAPPIPNAVTVQLSPTGSFNVYNENGTVDIIIDVNGYHTKASMIDLNTRLAAADAKAVAAAASVVAAEARISALEASSPRYAKVGTSATGATLIRSKGATGVSRIAIGIYQVDFAAAVDTCGWTATLNDDAAGLTQPGEIGVERLSGNDADSLWVRTFNSAGALQDSVTGDGFTLDITC